MAKGLVRRSSSKKMVATMVAAAMLFSAVASYADWQDDWLAGQSVGGPSYVQGSQRGYFSGGALSARWPSSNDHPLTITTPRIKMGCGGIDMFLGGFSFLNLDYLVQKLQRILSAAPAAAFDLALKTLAPQVAETIKALEALSDRLNGLQIDDCKASKALSAVVMSPFMEDTQGELGAAMTDFWTSTGIDDIYKRGQEDIRNIINAASGNTPVAGNKLQQRSENSTAGCPSGYLGIFAGGSILQNLARIKDIPSSYVRLMRGFIGDVIVHPPSQTHTIYQANYYPPCDKNQNIENFFVGDVEERDSSGSACVPNTDTNRNLYTYSAQIMASMAGKMRSGTNLNSQEMTFAATVPFTLISMLKTGVSTNTDPQVIGQLSEVAAKAFAYAMLSDLFARTSQMIEQAKHAESTTDGSAAGQDSDSCVKENFKGVVTQLQQLDTNIYNALRELKASLTKSAVDLNALQNMAENMRRFHDLSQSELSKRFGYGAAARVIGG